VWIAVYVDGVIHDPQFGLVVVEQKAMSTPAFRRALWGRMEYRYRCQLLAALRAGHFDGALWILDRKETAHLTEILFAQSIDRARIRLTAPNGSVEEYWIDRAGRQLWPAPSGVAADGATSLDTAAPATALADVPADGLWDTAQLWTPYDECELLAMYDRVKRVLTATPGAWHREYGPSFACARCAGQGATRCTVCKGTGQTPRARKACGRCGPAGSRPSGTPGMAACAACSGRGHLDEVELPAFPCGYCSVALTCWRDAGVRRTIDRRPHLWLRRDAYLASGIRVSPPEAPEPPAAEDEGNDEDNDE
jgi:hypothetical protein